MNNSVKTGLLLTALSLLLVGFGHLVSGPQGATMAFAFAVVMNIGAYWFSDRMVLAMYRAQPLEERDAPQVYAIVRELCSRASLPMPRLYWLPTQTPNAFATGRDPKHAAVAVTAGLVNLLDANEIRGVIAHELAHVKNRDTLTMSVAATLAGAIMWLASMARWGLFLGGGGRGNSDVHPAIRVGAVLLLSILAPLAAMLVQMAISRSREYAADSTGAQIAGSPFGLASALGKLEAAAERIPLANPNAATAHLFIANPLRSGMLSGLFATHPPMQERIARLQAMRV